MVMTNELQHWGIKGMRWGVRRYQNTDGTLTPAGKKRYDDTPNDAKEKLNHRQKLEAKYRSRGMSEQDAIKAADKRIRIEKTIAVVAGTTIAAASAYVISKNIKERTDTIIKSGTIVQRIGRSENPNLDRPFYAAFDKKDKIKYAGLLGKEIHESNPDGVVKTTLKATNDIKVASRKKSVDAFVDLYKNDSEFREAFKKSNEQIERLAGDQGRIARAASKEMSERALRKAGYDAFNIGLVNHDKNGNEIAKKFYDKLKDQGYDAVLDINDKKYSGYNSKNPIIVFNKAGKLSVSEVSKMTKDQVMLSHNKAQAMVLKEAFGTEMVKQGAKYAALAGGIQLTTTMYNTSLVNKYRIQHPNSKMTDKQIIEALKANQGS